MELGSDRFGAVTELPPLPHEEAAARRRPWLGYVMVLTAATLFAVNGVVSKVILASGLSSLRLTEVRLTGAALGLVLVLALASPGRLRVTRRSEEHTSELQSRPHLVCSLLLEKKKKNQNSIMKIRNK